jgi:hypothetical protein
VQNARLDSNVFVEGARGMKWALVIAGVLIAWRVSPSFIEGYRGRKGGFFAALGGALGRKLKH